MKPVYEVGQLTPLDANYPSQTVRVALRRWAERKRDRMVSYNEIMEALRWDNMNRCWCFIWCNMYVGIELDGHIHT